MSSKYLLREYYELCDGGKCEDFLTEGEKLRIKNDNALFLTGIIQCAENLNGNGRIYPRPILEREVKNYGKMIKERRALGELDHPDDSVINLKNVSHMVTDVWWQQNQVMGKIEILGTPSGNILRSLVESGVSLGISSRGLGSVTEQQGRTIVEDDYQLICFDIVQEPSTSGAFLMAENKNREIFTKGDRINRMLNDILEDY